MSAVDVIVAGAGPVGMAAALTLVSLSFPAWDATRRAHVFGGNPWIELHAAIALFSYGVFGLVALTSVMYLLRNFSLKKKNLRAGYYNTKKCYESTRQQN